MSVTEKGYEEHHQTCLFHVARREDVFKCPKLLSVSVQVGTLEEMPKDATKISVSRICKHKNPTFEKLFKHTKPFLNCHIAATNFKC